MLRKPQQLPETVLTAFRARWKDLLDRGIPVTQRDSSGDLVKIHPDGRREVLSPAGIADEPES